MCGAVAVGVSCAAGATPSHPAPSRFTLGVQRQHTQSEHEDTVTPLPRPRLFVEDVAAKQRLGRLIHRRAVPRLAAAAALVHLVAIVDR